MPVKKLLSVHIELGVNPEAPSRRRLKMKVLGLLEKRDILAQMMVCYVERQAKGTSKSAQQPQSHDNSDP